LSNNSASALSPEIIEPFSCITVAKLLEKLPMSKAQQRCRVLSNKRYKEVKVKVKVKLKQSHNIPMEAQGGEEIWLLLFIYGVGLRLWNTATTRHIVHPPDDINSKRRRNDTDRGKSKNSEKNLFQCHFVHHKSHMD
jgi:hypothetical protein